MDHPGIYNPATGPTHSNQRVFISHLHNSIYYFIETCFVMKIADDLYRLLVIHDKKVLVDRLYPTLLGAKFGFGKEFKKLAWSDEVVPFWSHFYQADPEWIVKWLSIAGN